MKFLMLAIFTFLLSFTSLSFAQSGGSGGGYDHGNGGDMCERRFKDVRDDIASWIAKGGASDLQLPSQVSLPQYAQSMLEKIKIGKVSCTRNKLLVGKAEKTCKNYSDKDGSSRIVCNRKLFLETKDSEQYILVHHEYAGLAGFEVNSGEESDYVISNQITGYLENKIVKKLAVKPRPQKEINPFDSSICQGPTITREDALKIAAPDPRDMDKIELGSYTMYTRERKTDGRGRWGEWENVSNRISLPDISGFYSYRLIPDRGVIQLKKEEPTGIQLYSTERTLDGRGIVIECNGVGLQSQRCEAKALPNFEDLGFMAHAAVTPNCAYINFSHSVTERSKNNTYNVQVQRESVFISRY